MGIGVDITVEEEGDVIIITLDGRIDATTTAVVEKKLAGLLEKSKKVLIDFSKVNYLSSAGMRLLLATTKKMKAHGGHIAFFGMTDDVMEIIKMAGFERVLNIYNTKHEAFKALK